MKYRIEFSEEKNLILQETRGLCFDDVIKTIENNKVLDDLKNKKYPNQKILVIKIRNYIYAVPYIVNKKKKTIFLKTVYPSRMLTKKYLKKG
jgi:hypothetical protein